MNIYFSLRVFHTWVSWWSFIGFQLTASLLGSPKVFSLFWQMLEMLWFRWSHFVPRFPIHLALLPSLSRPFKVARLCNILICRCMQKHIQHNKDEQIQFFRKIYLSFYSKGFERVTKGIICERWVGDWTELQHTDPTTLLAITAFLSRSPGLLNRGPGGPASAGTWFSFQLLLFNWLTSCRTRVT